MLNEDQKNRKLNDLLDALDFNQVRATGFDSLAPFGVVAVWLACSRHLLCAHSHFALMRASRCVSHHPFVRVFPLLNPCAAPLPCRRW
jgi:hypothetical protein